jgi:hypothetical protein
MSSFLEELLAGSPLLPGACNVKPERYSALITDAVDKGLSKLGRSPKEAIYETLKTDFSMRRKDIPTRFAEFSSILLENIDPSAKPLLEYVVDRFSCGIHDKSLSSIELGESIKRVDTILKDGQLMGARTQRKLAVNSEKS